MKDEKMYERIEEFLNGSLDPPEQQAFEQEVQADKNLATTVQVHQQMNQYLSQERDMEMESFIQDLGQNNFGQTEEKEKPKAVVRSINSSRIILAIAAMAVLLIGIFWIVNNNTETSQELYARYYTVEQVNFAERSTTGISGEFLNDGGKLFNQKQYTQAINQFDAFLKTNLQNAEARLFKGIAHAQLEQYKQAHQAFDTIISSKNPLFTDKARWHKAGAYLKQGKEQLAKKQLEALVKDPDADYHKQAVKLSEQID